MHMQVIQSTVFCQFSLPLFVILLLHKLHFLQDLIQFVDCVWLKAFSNKTRLCEATFLKLDQYTIWLMQAWKFPVTCLVAILLGTSNMQSDLHHKNEIHSCPSTFSCPFLLHTVFVLNYNKSHLHRTGVKSTDLNSLCK
jgi:hypothetical protein